MARGERACYPEIMTAFEPLPIVRPLPLRVEDFLLLNDSGAFEGYGKTELIDGGIVYMNAQHRPHARVKMLLAKALDRSLAEASLPHVAMTEVTVALPPHDAPEPDVVVTDEPDGEGPVPLASVALVVEVAHSTLDQDLRVKPRIYASAGVPEYWVADVDGRVIHQFWSPQGEAYAERREYAFGERIALVSLPIAIGTDLL